MPKSNLENNNSEKPLGKSITYTADLVIYGGTSLAVIAAVQAHRMGKTVLIVCPDKHLGGLTSSGLGWTDSGHQGVIGGLAKEFYHRVWKKYKSEEAWRWQEHSTYNIEEDGNKKIDDDRELAWTFEPYLAENIFEEWLHEDSIPVYREEWLDRTHDGVTIEGGCISSLRMLSGNIYTGKVFIDATYEGDLMAAAGISYHVGRESSSTYEEEWNGIQVGVLHHNHNFGHTNLRIDPYKTPGDPSSGVLAGISTEAPGKKGE
ncbi:MAG: FAD-dependent oxidoreductase, partial [Opitutaceae bacterium]|nr:FAD-dependent oxidoreductase [Opitutaceae bacterium]